MTHNNDSQSRIVVKHCIFYLGYLPAQEEGGIWRWRFRTPANIEHQEVIMGLKAFRIIQYPSYTPVTAPPSPRPRTHNTTVRLWSLVHREIKSFSSGILPSTLTFSWRMGMSYNRASFLFKHRTVAKDDTHKQPMLTSSSPPSTRTCTRPLQNSTCGSIWYREVQN